MPPTQSMGHIDLHTSIRLSVSMYENIVSATSPTPIKGL